MHEIREHAVRDRPLSGAVTSMTRWFRGEVATINRAIEIGRAHLSANPGDSETAASVRELEHQRDELRRGWQNSSLRRAVTERAEDSAFISAEQRSMVATSAPSDIRATGTSSTTTAKELVGHAAVFNRWTSIGDWFRERISPGAFTNALKTSDVRFLFNHSADYIFGRNTANTLELWEDSVGLAFRCYLLAFDGASYGLARRIDRRDISGCSFSFTVAKEEWRLATKAGGLDERTILEVGELFDVGPVVFPAYRMTSCEAVFEQVPARTAPVPAEPVPAMTVDDDDLLREIDRQERSDRLDRLRERLHRRDTSATRIMAVLDRLRDQRIDGILARCRGRN